MVKKALGVGLAALLVFAGGIVAGWMVREVNPYVDVARPVHELEPAGLPNRLVAQQASPDDRHVAQVLFHDATNQYYLAIVSRSQRTRLVFDRALPLDAGAAPPAVALSWRGNHTVVVELGRGADNPARRYSFDLLTAAFAPEQEAASKAPPPVTAAASPTHREQVTSQLRSVTLDTMDDRLLLYRQIPLSGVTYDELKAAVPALTPLRREAGDDLYEATLALEVFGYEGQIEFNFKRDVLYNYMYSADLPNARAMESLYASLQAYYTRHFGDYEEQRVQESDHYGVLSSMWDGEHLELGVVQNLSPGSFLLTWAFRPRR